MTKKRDLFFLMGLVRFADLFFLMGLVKFVELIKKKNTIGSDIGKKKLMVRF